MLVVILTFTEDTYVFFDVDCILAATNCFLNVFLYFTACR